MVNINKKNNFNIIARTILLTLVGSFIYAIHSGIRNNYGIMINSIVDNASLSFSSVSFVLAIGQLIFGLVQPIFGIITAKKGNKYAFIGGSILVTLGLLLTPMCKSIFSLLFCLGILLPAGSGAISFGIIIGAVGPKIPNKFLSTISGIINASSGIGNTIMSPIITYLILSGGLSRAMFGLIIPIIISLPISLFMIKKDNIAISTKKIQQLPKLDIKELLKAALKNRNYIFLLLGFFTCGFHMAIITNHLPTEIRSFGHSSESTAYAFSIYGITTIISSILSGNLCNKFKMKNVLTFYYGLRPITILFFILLPKTLLNMTVFTALFGFSGAATVPPVSGIINKLYGASSIATLFGLVFFSHQVGGFFGAWFGGLSYDFTNSYTLIWISSLVLSTFATIVSFAISEED